MKIEGVKLPDKAIIIYGKVFELVEDNDTNICDKCGLLLICKPFSEQICSIFGEKSNTRFELWKKPSVK